MCTERLYHEFKEEEKRKKEKYSNHAANASINKTAHNAVTIYIFQTDQLQQQTNIEDSIFCLYRSRSLLFFHYLFSFVAIGAGNADT